VRWTGPSPSLQAALGFGELYFASPWKDLTIRIIGFVGIMVVSLLLTLEFQNCSLCRFAWEGCSSKRLK
jgi:hypothetical protein